MVWGYGLLVVTSLVLIRWRGDEWWPATLLLFSPRWLFLAPWPALALACWWWDRRLLVGLAVVGLLVVGPLMNLSIPWVRQSQGRGLAVRIMTYNLGEVPLDGIALGRFIEGERLDVVCFQESRSHQRELEVAFRGRGWEKDRQGTIWSRLPIVGEWDDLTHFDGDRGYYRRYTSRVRVRASTGEAFVVTNSHLPTMQVGMRAILGGDLDSFRAHETWRAEQLDALRVEVERLDEWPGLVAGDLNTPADSPLLEPLRERFTFAFDRAGWGYGYTRPTFPPWTRIDHILADPRWDARRCWVGPDLGSDHLPLLAEVVLSRR